MHQREMRKVEVSSEYPPMESGAALSGEALSDDPAMEGINIPKRIIR